MQHILNGVCVCVCVCEHLSICVQWNGGDENERKIMKTII